MEIHDASCCLKYIIFAHDQYALSLHVSIATQRVNAQIGTGFSGKQYGHNGLTVKAALIHKGVVRVAELW